MSTANRVVQAVLGSPAHRVLSGSTVVVRYQGRRSGSTFATPVQYARAGDALVIGVATPERKTWWRNFQTEHPVEVLVRGEWTAMTGLAVDADRDPAAAEPLFAAYLARYPKAERHLRHPGSPTILVRLRPARLG